MYVLNKTDTSKYFALFIFISATVKNIKPSLLLLLFYCVFFVYFYKTKTRYDFGIFEITSSRVSASPKGPDFSTTRTPQGSERPKERSLGGIYLFTGAETKTGD